MTRKASLIVISTLFLKSKGPSYHMFNVKRAYPIKMALYPPNIVSRGSECENNL